MEATIFKEIMRVVQGRKKSECTSAKEHDVDERTQHTGKKDPIEELPKHGKSGVGDVHGGKGHAYDINMDVGKPSHIKSKHVHSMDVGESFNGNAEMPFLTPAKPTDVPSTHQCICTMLQPHLTADTILHVASLVKDGHAIWKL